MGRRSGRQAAHTTTRSVVRWAVVLFDLAVSKRLKGQKLAVLWAAQARHLRRAGYAERCPSGSEGAGWKRGPCGIPRWPSTLSERSQIRVLYRPLRKAVAWEVSFLW